jgi:hypothetical protein
VLPLPARRQLCHSPLLLLPYSYRSPLVTLQSSLHLGSHPLGSPSSPVCWSSRRLDRMLHLRLSYPTSSCHQPVLDVPFRGQSDARNRMAVSTCRSLSWLLSYFAVLCFRFSRSLIVVQIAAQLNPSGFYSSSSMIIKYLLNNNKASIFKLSMYIR